MSYFAKRLWDDGIVKDGLQLWLDASDSNSYPGTGNTWYDLSGNGNNGTLLNGVVPLSNAMQFDGLNDRLDFSLPILAAGLTLSCWFYRTAITQWSGLITNNAMNNRQSAPILGFIDNTNRIGTNRAGVNANSISIDLSSHLNQWIYAAIVFHGWQNGSKVDVYAHKGQLLIATGFLYWNMNRFQEWSAAIHWTTSNPLHFFKGNINDIAIYNRALTADEVAQNFETTRHKYGI